jgi:hypothetical protein
MRARHLTRLLWVFGLTVGSVSLGATAADVVAGRVDLLADLGNAAMMALAVVAWSVSPPRPSPELRTAAARALYFEAERAIAAMDPALTYRTGDVFLNRAAGRLYMQVWRLDRVENVDLPSIDIDGVAAPQVFTLLARVPLVRYNIHGFRVGVNADGVVVPLDPAVYRGFFREYREAWRQARFVRAPAGSARLATVEELRALVEQLRSAEPAEGF